MFLTFFKNQKITIYLSLRLHKGRPSYRGSLNPSKENIQHFKLKNFCVFVGSVLPTWNRILIKK